MQDFIAGLEGERKDIGRSMVLALAIMACLMTIMALSPDTRMYGCAIAIAALLASLLHDAHKLYDLDRRDTTLLSASVVMAAFIFGCARYVGDVQLIDGTTAWMLVFSVLAGALGGGLAGMSAREAEGRE